MKVGYREYLTFNLWLLELIEGICITTEIERTFRM